MEQIFFIALVAIVGLVRWLAQNAENKRNEAQATKEKPASAAPLARPAGQTEEERVRKFFEALGVPPTSAPPAQPSRRREIKPQVQPAAETPLPADRSLSGPAHRCRPAPGRRRSHPVPGADRRGFAESRPRSLGPCHL